MELTCPRCEHAWNEVLAGLSLVRENVEIVVRDVRTGERWTYHEHNIVTDVGLTLIGQLLGAGEPALSLVAIGTDGTTPAAGNTALGTEVHRAAISQTLIQAQQSIRRFFVPTSVANGNTLREAALLNADSILFSRVTHTDIIKTASLTVTYSWTHGFARA